MRSAWLREGGQFDNYTDFHLLNRPKYHFFFFPNLKPNLWTIGGKIFRAFYCWEELRKKQNWREEEADACRKLHQRQRRRRILRLAHGLPQPLPPVTRRLRTVVKIEGSKISQDKDNAWKLCRDQNEDEDLKVVRTKEKNNKIVRRDKGKKKEALKVFSF